MRTDLHVRNGLAVLLAIIVVLSGCSDETKPKIVAGMDACGECSMIIDTPGQACGFVVGSEFVTFDSPACLLKNYESRRKRGRTLPTEIYFADHEKEELHPASSVVFAFVDRGSTVMESGVLCYASREAAEAAAQPGDGRITDWEGYQLARGTPDREVSVRFEADGMVPEVVESVKDELLLWNLSSTGRDQNLVVRIKGYPEVGDITVPASGAPVFLRMKASRPGTGFPVIETGSERALGVLKVIGAHTPDEEAR